MLIYVKKQNKIYINNSWSERVQSVQSQCSNWYRTSADWVNTVSCTRNGPYRVKLFTVDLTNKTGENKKKWHYRKMET